MDNGYPLARTRSNSGTSSHDGSISGSPSAAVEPAFGLAEPGPPAPRPAVLPSVLPSGWSPLGVANKYKKNNSSSSNPVPNSLAVLAASEPPPENELDVSFSPRITKNLVAASNTAEEEQLHNALNLVRAREEDLLRENCNLKAELQTSRSNEEELRQQNDQIKRDVEEAETQLSKMSQLNEELQARIAKPDDAMQEFFEMTCVASRMRHGPFSAASQVAWQADLSTSPSVLYKEALKQSVPMWDWHDWIQQRLGAPAVLPEAAMPPQRPSRMCNWDPGAQPMQAEPATLSPPAQAHHCGNGLSSTSSLPSANFVQESDPEDWVDSIEAAAASDDQSQGSLL